MLLYIWIHKDRNIKNTGFNLSSHYIFDFEHKEINGTISGELTLRKTTAKNLFGKDFLDVRLIVGENGAGKTTLIDNLVNAFMINGSRRYDGIIIVNKMIFIPDNYELTSWPEGFETIRHVDIVNHTRMIEADTYIPRTLNAEQSKMSPGQLATSYLKKHSIIHYDAQTTLNRIYNIEGVASSTQNWETNYWHYFDLTTENMIVRDYNAFNKSYLSGMLMIGRSELLSHLSEESRRILTFISSPFYSGLPFKLKISSVYLEFNSFYSMSLRKILVSISEDTVTQFEGDIEQFFSPRNFDDIFYLSFVYGCLIYEMDNELRYPGSENKNALSTVIKRFYHSIETIKYKKTTRKLLESFLKEAMFVKKATSRNKKNMDYENDATFLLGKIDDALTFLKKSKKIYGMTNQGCYMKLDNETIDNFLKCFFFDFKSDNEYYLFDIFTMDMRGLSGGEKNLLSFFSRLHSSVTQNINDNSLKKTEKYIVFLDEFEISLHPNWQKDVLSLLHNMLPALLPGKKIQLILTSHSPIICSDLPKENILFLQKSKETGEAVVLDSSGQQNTFGANIYNLYKNTFFIEGLPMGSFANKEISKILYKIKKGNAGEETLATIEIIGDTIIRQRLKDLYYQKANKKEKLSYLKREIEKLNNSNDSN